MVSNAQRDAIWKQVHVEAAHSLLAPLDSNVPCPTKMKISPRSLETLLLDVRQTMEDEQNKELFANCAPLQWWREQQAFCALWPLVQMLLCIPASNAAAERTFSSSGFISKGRQALTVDHLEQHAMIRHHLLRLSSPADRTAIIHMLCSDLEGNKHKK